MTDRPDVVLILTDQERAIPPYESDELRRWRDKTLTGRKWFADHGVSFERHYTGSLACVPSRPTLLTGQYPDLHGVTQTDGLAKAADDSRMRWLPEGEVPTLGNWFRAAGYDTHYDGKWHISHADLVDSNSGRTVATNTSDGTVIPSAVQQYLDADPLAPFGFSGWVGPEPHGSALANCGLRRDRLICDRIVAWLEDRYARRRAGDVSALRPFLLVASFVNPHDICLFPLPGWQRNLPRSDADPPHVAAPPTRHEDLSSKPAAHAAWKATYYSAYGPAQAVAHIYRRGEQRYRDLYYRLHAEVDGPLDRVRRAVTENGSQEAVLVRTSDHGELLGAHGGLHQKWFNLYDEATRVPFCIVRVGKTPSAPRTIERMPTSHVDLVPTLLAAAGIDEGEIGAQLRRTFSEVHPLPGRNLMPFADAAEPTASRAVYLMTRDNMLEGDDGASALARAVGLAGRLPFPLRVRTMAHVGSNFEGIVVVVNDRDASGGAGHVWKLVRTFDDPSTWTEPGVRQLATNGLGGESHRDQPLADEWELYDLDVDSIEAVNRARDASAAAVLAHLRARLIEERARSVPKRNRPWPYATRKPATNLVVLRRPQPMKWARRWLTRWVGVMLRFAGHRATTSGRCWNARSK